MLRPPARLRRRTGHDFSTFRPKLDRCTARFGRCCTRCVHNGASRSARTQIQRVCDSISVCVGLTGERKRCVERALGVMSVPMRSQSGAKSVIANPALQVGRERRAGSDYRPGRGKPQKIAAAQEHLGAEEIMTGGKGDWRIENHRDRHLFSGDGTFAAGYLAGTLVDPVHDGVRHAEDWHSPSSRKSSGCRRRHRASPHQFRRRRVNWPGSARSARGWYAESPGKT